MKTQMVGGFLPRKILRAHQKGTDPLGKSELFLVLQKKIPHDLSFRVESMGCFLIEKEKDRILRIPVFIIPSWYF